MDQDGASYFSLVMSDYNRSFVLDATMSNLVLNCLPSHIREFSSEKKQLWKVGGEADPALVMSTAVDFQVRKKLATGWIYPKSCLPRLKRLASRRHDPLLPSDGMFDLISAAVTIYSERAARETVLLLQRHLRPATAVGLVARKRYHFGVGRWVALRAH